jgi:diguanylate cyclase (GGDEF) domain
MSAKFRAQVALEKSEAQVKNMAYYDALTGLPNRYLLSKSLQEAIAGAESTGRKPAVMFIDLDNFKNVNDIFGHSLGDMFLKQVAARLLSCTNAHTECSVFRYGGDEFIVLMSDTDEVKCASFAESVVGVFTLPFHILENEIYSSPSIGISIYPKHGENPETLIKNSDNAMYLAKKKGKNNYRFFNDRLNTALSRKIELENGLRKALQNNEFVLYYQPLIELDTNKVYGVEALIRWVHPTLGMISPLEFIPLAEDSGLIVPIGEWVLETACRQNKAWAELGIDDILMSINVSGIQLKYSDFCKIVKDKLEDTGVPTKNLIIEITESVMQDSVLSSRIVNELKKMGVKVAIDDFGTGYSSMGLLKNLNIDILKIDSSFINDVSDNPNALVILKHIINMGEELNFCTVIEGIETESQANLLKLNKCKYGQGYFFSRPLPAEEIEAALKTL